MRVQPFSFLEQLDTTPPAGNLPKEGNILFRYEDVNTNSNGSRWLDSSPNGYTSTIMPNATIDTPTNSVLLDSSGINRNKYIRVTTNTDITIKSLIVLFNQPLGTGGSGDARAYFWDFRRANRESPNNAAYWNQWDSISTGPVYSDGSVYAYDESSGVRVNGLPFTPATVTDGFSNSTGGDDTWQWMGINGRGANTSKRLWMFNFGTGRDLNLDANAQRGMVFGANDNLSESSTFGYYSIVAWDTYLTEADYTDIISYYQSQGVIT